MLWTMADPVLRAQCDGGVQPVGNRSDRQVPHNAYRCCGDDAWIALAVRNDADWRALCNLVPELADQSELSLTDRIGARDKTDSILVAWFAPQDAQHAADRVKRAGLPAAALADSAALVASAHLHARGFWDDFEGGVLPGLPWRADFGRIVEPAPGLGADTDDVLRDVLRMSQAEIDAARRAGAFG